MHRVQLQANHPVESSARNKFTDQLETSYPVESRVEQYCHFGITIDTKATIHNTEWFTILTNKSIIAGAT